MDKEYIILDEINENQHISQRQLAERTGLSLGSINLLLKKMIREGLIKMETIPANQINYILTPKGIMEKSNKTYKYIKYHYRMIEETKKKVKDIVLELLVKNEIIYIILREDEISFIVKACIEELDIEKKILIFDEDKEINDGEILLTLNNEDYDKYGKLYNNIINLFEIL